MPSYLFLIVQDPRAVRPYLFSDEQNMYNRVALVCRGTYTFPLAWADGKFSGTRYYRYVKIILTLLTVLGLILT